MKIQLVIAFLAVSFSLPGYCQNYTIKRGEEIKMNEASNNIEIIERDNTGVYILQGRVKTNRLSIKEPYSTEYKLYKFDNNYSLKYSEDLKDYKLNSIQPLNGELYWFASDYNKKQNSFTVYGTTINKSSGHPDPGFTAVTTIPIESDDDRRSVKIAPVDKGKSFSVITRIYTDTKKSIHVTILDSKLKKIKSTVINFPVASNIEGNKEDVLEKVIYSNSKIYVLVKRIEAIKVKKDIDWQVKNRVLIVYTTSGKKEKETIVDFDGNFIRPERLEVDPAGDILLAGFYKANPDTKELKGFYIHRFNGETGQLEKTISKELDPAAMFPGLAKGTATFFPENFVIQSIDTNPADRSTIIIAENSYTTSGTYTDRTGGQVSRSVDRRHMSESILVMRIDRQGVIGWINMIPKMQTEIFGGADISGGWVGAMSTGGGMPYYSSYTHLIKDNKLLIILNDDEAQTTNPKYGTALKEVQNFKKSNLYAVSVDLASGKMERNLITANNSDDILAPRHSFVQNNEILMPTWRNHRIGKAEFRLVQINVE